MRQSGEKRRQEGKRGGKKRTGPLRVGSNGGRDSRRRRLSRGGRDSRLGRSDGSGDGSEGCVFGRVDINRPRLAAARVLVVIVAELSAVVGGLGSARSGDFVGTPCGRREGQF